MRLSPGDAPKDATTVAQSNKLKAIFNRGLSGVPERLLALGRGRSRQQVAAQSPSPNTPESVRVVAENGHAKPPSGWRVIAAALGLACLVLAQALLLESQQPVLPLILYLLGIGLLLPALNSYTETCETTAPAAHTQENRYEPWQERRLFYAAGAVFFTMLTLVAAQTGVVSPFAIFTWLMSIVLTMRALLAGQRFMPGWPQNLAPILREASGLVALMAIATILLYTMPPPTPSLSYSHLAGPLYAYIERVLLSLTHSSNVNLLTSILAVLLVPGVYLVARALGGAQMGFVAAGLVAVSGWTLALGKVGHVYSVMALLSALCLAALLYAERSRQRAAYLWVGILLGVGWLFSSLFMYLALLVPLAGILIWLDERREWRPIARNHAAALLMLVIVVVPFQTARNSPPTSPLINGLDPMMSLADGLSSSLLMFNLTSDPVPLHGIINWPVFSPIMAAAFAVGILVCVFRAYDGKRWWNWLPLAALVIALLPSAVSDYPDLQRAALALPLSMTIAASGLALVARPVMTRWKRAGKVTAITVFILALVIIAADARQHYIQVFLPTYEQAAPMYNQFAGD